MALQRTGIEAMGARRVKAESSVLGGVTVDSRSETPLLYLHLNDMQKVTKTFVLLHIIHPLGWILYVLFYKIG